MPGPYRKHLPKLNFVKENSRTGATALPLTVKINVGPCFTLREEMRDRPNKRQGVETVLFGVKGLVSHQI